MFLQCCYVYICVFAGVLLPQLDDGDEGGFVMLRNLVIFDRFRDGPHVMWV